MRAAIRAISPDVHSRSALAAWASLPALYHRWAMGPGGEAYVVAEETPSPSARRAPGVCARVLGYAAVRGAELTAVFVRPGAQGQGVGRALAEAVARLVRRRGHPSLRVDAARAAIPFYTALGFRGASPLRVPLPGGRSLAAVRMRLGLGDRPSSDRASKRDRSG